MPVVVYLGLCLIFVLGFWLFCLVVVIARCSYVVVIWVWLIVFE